MAQEIADSKLIDTWASSGNIVEPDISKIIEGWQLGEQPPHEYMNWLQNIFGSKLNHILKNGVASWNNTTQYLAGSSVQHNGNVWLCKTTNTNSAPTDANANWKRIITVESLTTVLNGYVSLTRNQTIAGVKTFSDNPISTATQSTAVNALTRKDYVDGLDSTNVKLTGNQTIAGVKTFLNPIEATTTINNYTGAGLITYGNGETNTIFPTIGFHQLGLFAGSIALTSNGVFSFFSSSGNIKASIDADLIGNATTVTNGVYTTGNQTIAGVKTFSSSPIVPTPTTSGNVITMDNIIQKTPVTLGYGGGAGGAVTQLTSKSTSVTLNKPCGLITMNNAALAVGASVNFILNNSLVDLEDIVVVNTRAFVNYTCEVYYKTIGIVGIRVTNITGNTLSEEIRLNFAVIKGSVS